MPGDSLSNQQTPIDKKNYDAIVIGTGMSGGWAMKELTEQGLTVLAIERGRNLQHIKDYDTATLNPWTLKATERGVPSERPLAWSDLPSACADVASWANEVRRPAQTMAPF